MLKRFSILTASAALGFGIAACGSSSTSSIALAPSSGPTSAAVTSTTTTTSTSTTTPSTSTVSTPKPPSPLSKEPVVLVPKTPAPKNLVIKDLIKGTGKAATVGSTITVNYVGVLYKGGTQFDASWKRHQTFSTALTTGNVISGWVKGIAGMKVGGRRELIIPPADGYGKAGSPPTIPANSTLIFVVDLLAVS